jgi:hypothetical protein
LGPDLLISAGRDGDAHFPQTPECAKFFAAGKTASFNGPDGIILLTDYPRASTTAVGERFMTIGYMIGNDFREVSGVKTPLEKYTTDLEVAVRQL